MRRLSSCRLPLSNALGLKSLQVDVLTWKSKNARVTAQIKDLCAILSGLVVAQDYKKGQQLVADREFADNSDFFQVCVLGGSTCVWASPARCGARRIVTGRRCEGGMVSSMRPPHRSLQGCPLTLLGFDDTTTPCRISLRSGGATR